MSYDLLMFDIEKAKQVWIRTGPDIGVDWVASHSPPSECKTFDLGVFLQLQKQG